MRELLEVWMAAAAEVGLAFAGEPDERVDASLAQMRQRLIAKFVALFQHADQQTLAAGVDSIIAEIQKRRREIEAAGPRGADQRN
jgi:hypothetical protein